MLWSPSMTDNLSQAGYTWYMFLKAKLMSNIRVVVKCTHRRDKGRTLTCAFFVDFSCEQSWTQAAFSWMWTESRLLHPERDTTDAAGAYRIQRTQCSRYDDMVYNTVVKETEVRYTWPLDRYCTAAWRKIASTALYRREVMRLALSWQHNKVLILGATVIPKAKYPLAKRLPGSIP